MTIKFKHFTLSLLLLTLCYACGQSKELKDNQLKLLDSIAKQDVPRRAPGVAVGIVQNGNIIYETYAGYANLEDSILINNKSRFNIASNGKQFTALAILKLIDEGKLSLKDDLKKFFPDFYNNITDKITIANLLTHTSGIRDIYDLWSLQGIVWWKRTLNNQDAIKLLSNQEDLNFNPGSQYLYSNSNYILLAEIVNKISGQNFVAYTNKMFEDLGMPNTSFISNHKQIEGQIARPYFNFDTWKSYDWLCDIYGDGNLFSTLEDQLHWEQLIQRPSGKFAELIETSQHLVLEINPSYGYGLEFDLYKGIPYKFHEGATGAWKATTVRFPKEHLAIVTLTNTGKSIPGMQTRQMADVLLNVKNNDTKRILQPQIVGEFVEIDSIIGVYQNKSNFTFRFEKRGDDLYLLRNGRNDTKLVREADNIFTNGMTIASNKNLHLMIMVPY